MKNNLVILFAFMALIMSMSAMSAPVVSFIFEIEHY